MKNLVYEGSVKKIWALVADESSLLFEFTDHYSIFDWGHMPDQLKNKGKSLTLIAQAFFEYLQGKGVKTHYIGLEEDKIKVQKVDIQKPVYRNGTYDYSAFKDKPSNTLVPLEVVFRFGVPEGSSLLKRRPNEFQLGEVFSSPLIEFSTKLESSDRYLSHQEASRIAGLDELEFNNLIRLSELLAIELKKVFDSINIELWDGKFEFAWDEKRGFILVDSIGPDELRLIYQNKHLSKESLRQFYVNSLWLDEVEEKKVLGENWRDKVCLGPEPLSSDFKERIENMYMKLTDDILIALGKDKFFNIEFSYEELV